MRILIIGAGAVGGYFAARLINAGRDVSLLVRPARAAQLRSTGLEVVSAEGDFTVEPKLLLAADLRTTPRTFDLILVSTKAYSLDAAIEDFAPAVGPQTAILPLLNGMKHLDTLVARFGESAILGGASRIFADLDARGSIHIYSPLHDILFGERNLKVTGRTSSINAALQDCGFPVTLAPDILAAMWTKWVMLSSVAATTCLLRGTIGSIAGIPGGSQTAVAILTESAAIAAANGYVPPAKITENVIDFDRLPLQEVAVHGGCKR